jgi:hypothetical protein
MRLAPKRKRKAHARGGRYPIQDPAAVAALLDEVVRARHDGKRARAAHRGQIDRATLIRLLQGEQPSIRHGTYKRIVRYLLEPGEVLRLDAALGSPLGGVNLEWVQMRAAAPGFGPDVRPWDLGARALVLTDVDRDAIPKRARERWRLYQKEERSALWRHVLPLCEDLFDEFTRFAVDRGHDGMRIAVAEERVLAPLLEHAESGFRERNWREMPNAELVRFIRLGFQRERILLLKPAMRLAAVDSAKTSKRRAVSAAAAPVERTRGARAAKREKHR